MAHLARGGAGDGEHVTGQERTPKGSPRGGRYRYKRTTEPTVDVASASLPDALSELLPPGTSNTWLKIAPLLPASAYLTGGTALTAHLHHRVSRDLDIFLERPADLGTLWAQFQAVGDAHSSYRDDSTLNCTLDDTKVQVLEASSQKMVSEFTIIGGIRVAGVADILATKVAVVAKRGELRDYFDIMTIEQSEGLTAEEGINLAIKKYSPDNLGMFVLTTLRALSHFDDVENDSSLPVPKEVIVRYWMKRRPSLRRHIESFG